MVSFSLTTLYPTIHLCETLVMEKKSFSQWLTEKMASKGWNQTKLAERSGLTRQYISKLINEAPHSATGKKATRPTDVAVDKIAKALGASVTEARLVAGYAPAKEDEQTQEALLQSRFGLMMRKYDALPKNARPHLDSLLEMVERELDKKLPPGTELPIDAYVDNE